MNPPMPAQMCTRLVKASEGSQLRQREDSGEMIGWTMGNHNQDRSPNRLGATTHILSYRIGSDHADWRTRRPRNASAHDVLLTSHTWLGSPMVVLPLCPFRDSMQLLP